MDIVLMVGDGIGREICDALIKVNDVLCQDITFHKYECGAEYYMKTNNFFEEGLFNSLDKYQLAIKGPTATPIGKGFRSLNVQLREYIHSYANVRPIKKDDIDLIIVRENSEDLYKGIEYMYDDHTAHSIKVITKEASEKIITFAFEEAIKQKRHKVTCVHKANIMKLTDGLFLKTFNEIKEKYPTIESEDVIVDAMCMKLVMKPSDYDVIVAPNLYGDILSDLCAGLVGGLGLAPGVNIGDKICIYEAVHGAANDIAGKNIANPTALLKSYSLLLKDYNHEKESDKLDKAIDYVIKENKYLTPDLGGNSQTYEYIDRLIEVLR